MTSRIAITLLLLAATPLPALAQSVAILPPKVDPQVPAPEAKATLELIAAHLKKQGFSALEPAALLVKLPRKLRTCNDADCAHDTLAPLGADMALLVSLFPASGPGAPSISLELIDKAGVSYAGSAESHPGESPVTAALDDAIARQRRGPGPWITIQGEPSGADILINGKPVGELPRYTGRVDPGMAHILVREPGYKELNQLLDIGQSLDGSKVLDVKLAKNPLPSLAEPVAMSTGSGAAARSVAIDADDTAPPTTERRASATDYVLGGAFAGGGLLLMTIDPIRAASKAGDCVDTACKRQYTFSTRDTAEVIGGAAMVIAGAAIAFWWKPFAVRVATGERTTITVNAHF